MTLTTTPTLATSTTEHRIGWALTGLVRLLLLVDAATKLVRTKPVLDSFAELGWAEHLAVPVGLILLVCTVLHLVPRTSVLGTLLFTAYLGGAMATNLRVEKPLLSTVLFSVYLGVALWAGLVLRDGRVRALLLGR